MSCGWPQNKVKFGTVCVHKNSVCQAYKRGAITSTQITIKQAKFELWTVEDFNNLGLFITEKSQYSDCLCTRSVTRIHQNFGGLCVENPPTPVINHKNYTPKQILLKKNLELFLLCYCCKFWDCSTSVATTEFSQTLLLLSEFFLSSASCFPKFTH